jgi:uncharacterized coiled-coil DUF342 family protein
MLGRNKMEEQTFVKQMSEMKSKADKYDGLMRRYDELFDKLKGLANVLYGIMHEIRPTIKSVDGTRQRTKREGVEEVLDYVLKYIKAGKYLSIEDLKLAFPDRT